MAKETETETEWKISSLCGNVNLGKRKPLTDEDKEPFRGHLKAHERRCNKCRELRGFVVKPRTRPEPRRGKQTKVGKEFEKTGELKELGDEMKGKEEKPTGQQPEREPDEPQTVMPVPNKITIQYGQVLVGIESADESTETICNFAMQCIGELLGVRAPQNPEKEAPKPEEKPIGDDNADLGGQKEYETLMKAIK